MEANGAPFAIDAEGRVTVLLEAGQELDFETTSSYEGMNVTVTDDSGLAATGSLTINIDDVNEPVSFDTSAYRYILKHIVHFSLVYADAGSC